MKLSALLMNPAVALAASFVGAFGLALLIGRVFPLEIIYPYVLIVAAWCTIAILRAWHRVTAVRAIA